MVQNRRHENQLSGQTASPDLRLSVEVSPLSCAKCGAIYTVGTVAVPVPAVERKVDTPEDRPTFSWCFLALVSHNEKQITTRASVMARYYQTRVLKDYGDAVL